MNSQMPYGYINMSPNNDIRMLLERIDSLERRVSKLEKKLNMMDKPSPTLYNQDFPNNYMI